MEAKLVANPPRCADADAFRNPLPADGAALLTRQERETMRRALLLTSING